MYLKTKIVVLLFLLLGRIISYSQLDTVSWGKNKYPVYTSLSAASKVHPDSVKGLRLYFWNLKDFPKEVLRYKKLKYLEIGSYRWVEIVDSLPMKEKKRFEKIKKEYKDLDMWGVKHYTKGCRIVNIPAEIKELKELVAIDMLGVWIANKRKFKKIFEYLPNVDIIPDKQWVDEH